MHHFEMMDGNVPQQMNNPMLAQQQLANQPRTFREDYQGVIQGLMSTVQLGYTGVSFLYFFQNVKGMIADFKEKILPSLIGMGKVITANLSFAAILKRVLSILRVRSLPDALIKAGLFLAIVATLYIYIHFQRKKSELLSRKLDKQKAAKPLARTSEEFWHNSNAF